MSKMNLLSYMRIIRRIRKTSLDLFRLKFRLEYLFRLKILVLSNNNVFSNNNITINFY